MAQLVSLVVVAHPGNLSPGSTTSTTPSQSVEDLQPRHSSRRAGLQTWPLRLLAPPVKAGNLRLGSLVPDCG
jgi:hypothetical protein